MGSPWIPFDNARALVWPNLVELAGLIQEKIKKPPVTESLNNDAKTHASLRGLLEPRGSH